MANLLLFSALILVLILTAFESVTARLTYNEEVIISLDFLIFKLILYPSRKKKSRDSNNKPPRKLKERLGRARAIRDTVDYVLSHGDVVIHELELKIREDDPARFVLKSRAEDSLLAALIVYLSLEIQSLKIEDDIFKLPRKIEVLPTPLIDFTVKTALYNAIVAYVIYTTKTKKARRRGYAAVRK
ncbi:MAG: hypothetical protein J6V09_06320 [Clostridia bacterium]|nr:hypothetical protein [Clostridia bacterium]